METNNQQLAPQIEYVYLEEQGPSKKLEKKLTEDEIKICKDEFSSYLTLSYNKAGEHFVRATHYAGILVLPNHVIKIKPKINNANFFGMLKYALELPKIDPKKQYSATEKFDFWEILVEIFLGHLNIIFQRNLYSDYVETEDNLNFVRGKIDFTQHILQNFNRPDKIYCRFTEFTRNVLENRLIKTTLYKLIFGSQYNIFPREMKEKLNDFYRKFDFADLILANPVDIFKIITYTQLNSHYEPILKICEFLLREQAFDLARTGAKSGFQLMVNMNELFEQFIKNMLKTKKFDILYHETVYWPKIEEKPHYPDFIVRKNRKDVLILDTKYYGEDEKKTKEKVTLLAGRLVPIANIAQMVFYSNSTGIKKLSLLYPGKHEPDKIEIKNDIELNIFHIDLEGETREDFEDNCEKLKNQLLKCVI